MSKKEKGGTKETMIVGFVEEVELEDGDSGLQIDDGDDRYLVVMDKNGKKLSNYIDEEVEITGFVNRAGGHREIKVSHFRLSDDFDDDEDDDRSDDDDDFFDNRYDD